jgi:hypothetical protein
MKPLEAIKSPIQTIVRRSPISFFIHSVAFSVGSDRCLCYWVAGAGSCEPHYIIAAGIGIYEAESEGQTVSLHYW